MKLRTALAIMESPPEGTEGQKHSIKTGSLVGKAEIDFGSNLFYKVHVWEKKLEDYATRAKPMMVPREGEFFPTYRSTLESTHVHSLSLWTQEKTPIPCYYICLYHDT